MSEKVYCKACKYRHSFSYCRHPDLAPIVHHPLERRIKLGSCTEINTNNDCPHFKKASLLDRYKAFAIEMED